MSSLGSNLKPDINCQTGVSGRTLVNVFAIHQEDVKPEKPSTSIGCWSTLNIPRCLYHEEPMSWSQDPGEIPNSSQLHSNVRPGQLVHERLELM